MEPKDPWPLQSDHLDKLIPDFIALQGKLGHVTKDKTNPHFNSSYADLASVVDVARPLLFENNFALNHQRSIDEAGHPILVTTLWHESGQFLRSVSPIEPEKKTFQGVGSAITYTRRYDGMAIIGIAPAEDDDGNAAGAMASKKKTSRPAPQDPQEEAPPPAAALPADPFQRAKDLIASAVTPAEITPLFNRANRLAEEKTFSTEQQIELLQAMNDRLLEMEKGRFKVAAPDAAKPIIDMLDTLSQFQEV